MRAPTPQIERTVAQWQSFQIRGNGERGPLRTQLRPRIDRDRSTHHAFQHAQYRAARRAKIGGKLEFPQHDGEPLRKFSRHTIEQKRFRPARRSPARAERAASCDRK